MYLLRRAAVRSFTASPLKTRSIVTKTPTALRQSQKWQIPVFQARFASNEASPSDAKTTGETVPTENESVETEAQAEQETNVEEKSVATPDVADAASAKSSQPQQAMEQMKEQVSEKATQAAEAVESARQMAAESLLGRSTAREAGTHKEPKPSRILYVGNLYFEVKAQDLLREFAKYGSVVNYRIAEDGRGLSRGFGFVEFENLDDALKAKDELDQKDLAGRRMAVQFHLRRDTSPRDARRNAANPPSRTLFIGNMSFQMSDKDLNDVFRPIKNVIDVRVAVDRRSGQPRGFCHADFIDVASAEEAKKILSSKEIYGRRLRIDFSQSTSTGNGNRPRRDNRDDSE